MGRHLNRDYALYKGDTFLDLGKARYLSEKWGISMKSLYWMAHCNRVHQQEHKWRICCNTDKRG